MWPRLPATLLVAILSVSAQWPQWRGPSANGLSAEKNLTIYAKLYGVADVPGQVRKELTMLGLWERRGDGAGGFTKGMRPKPGLAPALVAQAPLLFPHGPFSDPKQNYACAFGHYHPWAHLGGRATPLVV